MHSTTRPAASPVRANAPLARPCAAPRKAQLAAAALCLALAAAAPAQASTGSRAHRGRATAHQAQRAHKAQRPAVTLTSVSVEGATITVAGRVQLPHDTAAERRRTLVWLTLTGGSGASRRSETFSARISARERFDVRHATRLTGALGLQAIVRVAGRAIGGKLVDTLDVAVPAAGSGQSAAGSGAASGNPTSGGSGSSPTSSSGSEGTSQPTVLDGTFELTPGSYDAETGAVSGSWFEMLDADEQDRQPLQNGNSPLANQDYTPLYPGSDGGLETFAQQPAPSPAFSESGNALADAIMQPQNFFGDDFSVVSQATDPQTGETDPLPRIVDTAGQLSGQVTAWAVGWNKQWFNQGAPKPDGSLSGGTTAPSGTYTAASGHYTLEWRSLIVGGPFNGFLGSWHLEGTFVPQG